MKEGKTSPANPTYTGLDNCTPKTADTAVGWWLTEAEFSPVRLLTATGAGRALALFGALRLARLETPKRQSGEAHESLASEKAGGRLALEDVPVPAPRPGSVLVRVEASSLMSYLKAYVDGKLPFYNPPAKPFTIGTNAIGTVEAVGRDVWGLKAGQRVVVSSHFVARENVDDPAQILIGLTAGAGAAEMLADWPDGTLAEYALAPVEAVTRSRVGERGRGATRGLEPLHRPLWRPPARRLAAGETLVVNGATGAYGTAAVLLGVAMGAAESSPQDATGTRSRRSRKPRAPRRDGRAFGRCRGRRRGDPRGLRRRRPRRLRHGRQCGRSALDAGGADDLRRSGRLVLMGSMTVEPADPLHPGHAQQLGDFWPVHVSGERRPTSPRSHPRRPSRPRRTPVKDFR